MIARRTSASFAVLLAANFAAAQTGPQLNTVFPPGAKAGETVEVTVTGVGFDGDEKLVFGDKDFKAERVGAAAVDPKAPKGAPATSSVKFKVTAPKDATTTDVRIASKSGISNPRAFVVGDMTEANETEPNNDVGQAQKINLNTTVNGAISAPTDVDYVSFKAKAGQNVVVYCLTTSIDSRLSADLLVATPDGKRIAENRGYRGGDAVLDFKAPSDGEYLVRVSQFAYSTGGPDHFYRLTVTTGDWTDAVFPPVYPTRLAGMAFGREPPESRDTQFTRPDGRPYSTSDVVDKFSREPYPPGTLRTRRPVPPSAAMLDAIGSGSVGFDGNLLMLTTLPVVFDNEKNTVADAAQAVELPCDVAGRIGKKNDRHWYAFGAKKGEVWAIELFAERLGSQIDAFFTLTDEKGKVIVEADDGPPTLSPNQFYTTSDDPARYRFAVPADGKYRVMVSARDAGVQFGVREQYVLRIAKEKPDFRLAIMPITPHLPDATTLPKGGAAMLAVFVFRLDGFNDSITLTARGLPPGVTCLPQVIGPGQTRALLVLTADKDAEDWEGHIRVTGSADRLTHAARPFTVVWTPAGTQAGQPPPNTPMLTRMDRSDGPALAVRGTAPFSLTPTETEFTAKAGGKIDVTLKVERDEKFKDAIQVFNAVAQNQPGGKGPAVLATIPADKSEMKVTVDVPNNLPPGAHSIVLRGQSAAPPPKQPNNAVARPTPQYPAVPITVTIEGKETPKKK